MIDRLNTQPLVGVRLKHSAGRALLRKLGMQSRRCGLVPGKAQSDEGQRHAQQACHDRKLQSLLEGAKQGRRTVLFVDAAHFVMEAFLGMLWCCVRQWLPSSSGRQRYSVLGAYDSIRHEAVTLTNVTIVNQSTFCALLDKIAVCVGTGLPITLVLDNARYQKCQPVFDKAGNTSVAYDDLVMALACGLHNFRTYCRSRNY